MPPKLPDPSPILNLINGFRQSKVLFTVVQLGIIEHLAKLYPRRCTADELHKNLVTTQSDQSAILTNSESLERLLNASVGLGLLDFSNSESSVEENSEIALKSLQCRYFGLTPLSKSYLTNDSPIPLNGNNWCCSYYERALY